MNLVSHTRKKIYIHIPKNGGHSIVELLTGTLAVPLNQRPNKDNWVKMPLPLNQKFLEKKQIDLKSYFIFTFVRNPYSRFLSGWKNLYHKYQKSGIRYSHADFNLTKEEFRKSYKMFEKGNRDQNIHINWTQTKHLGPVFTNINQIFKFEDFDTGYKQISSSLYSEEREAPIRFGTPLSTPYQEWMTDEIITYVNKKFHDDFINFNYEKE